MALYVFFKRSRTGAAMRAVVDNSELLDLGGTSPTAVRRWACIIGCSFVVMSGALIVPSLGLLDAYVLTLLVVQSFGAAAIGYFSNLPLTYAGGLAIGVVASLATKYSIDVSWLNGLPPSLPFIVLFLVLILTPRCCCSTGATSGRGPGRGALAWTGVDAASARCGDPRRTRTGSAVRRHGARDLHRRVDLRHPVPLAGACWSKPRGRFRCAISRLRRSGPARRLTSPMAPESPAPRRPDRRAGVRPRRRIHLDPGHPPLRRVPASATLGFGIFLERMIYTTSWMFGTGIANGLVTAPPVVELPRREQ